MKDGGQITNCYFFVRQNMQRNSKNLRWQFQSQTGEMCTKNKRYLVIVSRMLLNIAHVDGNRRGICFHRRLSVFFFNVVLKTDVVRITELDLQMFHD